MDRRSLIQRAGIAGVLAAGVAPAVHAQAAIRWRLASSFPKSLDTIYGGADVFAKAVKAAREWEAANRTKFDSVGSATAAAR